MKAQQHGNVAAAKKTRTDGANTFMFSTAAFCCVDLQVD